MSSRFSKPSRSKTLIIVGILVVAIASAGALWIKHSHNTPPAPPGVKLASATKQEKQEANDNKDRILAQEKNGQTQNSQSSQASAASPAAKKQVSVIVTSADASIVTAYASGVFEDGGTCTATFTQGGTVVTRNSAGFKNVSYSQCTPITPNLPNAGSWSVVVSYSSATAEGKSQAQSF